MLILLANQSAASELMTEVATWSTTDDSNVDIFPEGMYLGQVNNAGRAMQGALARQFTGVGTKYIAPAGAVGAPTYTFTGSATSGWYLPAADTPALSIAGSEALRVNSSGVLIGTSSAVAADYKVNIVHPTNGILLKVSGTASNYLAFYDNTSVLIGSVARSGPTGSAVVYNTTSDARLKDVIGPVASGDLIDALNPIRFTWKRGGSPARSGFIAQELATVIPEAVTPGDTGATITTPWMVDVSALIPVVVAELKSLRKRVSSLEARADQSPTTLPGERTII
jgi:hypothetical protein